METEAAQDEIAREDGKPGMKGGMSAWPTTAGGELPTYASGVSAGGMGGGNGGEVRRGEGDGRGWGWDPEEGGEVGGE